VVLLRRDKTSPAEVKLDGDEAIRILKPISSLRTESTEDSRIRGRILTTLGDAYRIMGKRCAAGRLLRDAVLVLDELRFMGDLADFAWTAMAKLEYHRIRALDWLARAKEVQSNLGNPIGLARTLLLEARRSGDIAHAALCKEEIDRLRAEVVSLRDCRLLERILTQWDKWISEACAGTIIDRYWGL